MIKKTLKSKAKNSFRWSQRLMDWRILNCSSNLKGHKLLQGSMPSLAVWFRYKSHAFCGFTLPCVQPGKEDKFCRHQVQSPDALTNGEQPRNPTKQATWNGSHFGRRSGARFFSARKQCITRLITKLEGGSSGPLLEEYSLSGSFVAVKCTPTWLHREWWCMEVKRMISGQLACLSLEAITPFVGHPLRLAGFMKDTAIEGHSFPMTSITPWESKW